MFRKLALAGALFAATACSSADDAPNEDPDAAVDAGVVDTGLPLPVDAGNQPQPDAGPQDTGVEPDAGVVVNEVTVSGQVYGLGAYLAGNNVPAGGVSVFAYGAPGTTPVTSAPNTGAYSIVLPANGQVVLGMAGLNYNQSFYGVTTTDQPYPGRNLYIAEAAWLAAIADYHNVDIANPFACQTVSLSGRNCFYSAIVGRIYDDGTAGNGVARGVAGIQADDFTIYGPGNQQWYVRGPYFLDYDGTPDEAGGGTTSIIANDGTYRGGLYIVFVEVAVGLGLAPTTMQLSINYEYQPNAYRYFGPVAAQTFSTSFGTTRLSDIRETLTPPPVPVGEIDFDAQIYPLFLPIAEGGFGCVGCHTNQGGNAPSGGMNLYGGPDVAYASLTDPNYPQRVNLANPAASYLLVRPLFEADGVQDHPIFAFSSPEDPAYQLIYTWISEGALRNNNNLDPVSFYDEVRPLLYNPSGDGGAGCYACHVNGADADDAPGGLYMGGECDDLYTALTAVAPNNAGPYDEPYRINKDPEYTGRSLLLTNPLFGNPEPHPVKIFSDVADARYQLVYRWIAEGYENDCQ